MRWPETGKGKISWPVAPRVEEFGTRPSDLDALVGSFLLSQDVSQSSRTTYGKGLRRFLSWLATEEIQMPRREDILAYKEHLKAKGFSPPTISNYLVAVRKFFDWTEGIRLYPNVARGIKGTKRAKGFRKDPLTVAQVKELLIGIDLSTSDGKRDYALLNLLVRTGLRTVEAARADVGDISQESGEAVLWVQGKGRDTKDELVLLTDATLKPIHEYIRLRAGIHDLAPLFVSHSDRNRNQRLTTRSISRIAKSRMKSIGLDSGRFTAHSLRHTAITLSLQGGASVQEARVLGRHADVNTTLIYAHNIDRIVHAPERKIDAVLAMEC
ncbi:integrase [candidate division TA06 bacterium]|uniref:Integrase n=1 Tax=candidate division TA06 bacterium TaxID=2250710 RepID=A0A523UT22_UNCT6|nr:MAG: integrase [candidate division TA06 bacterium]